MSKPLKIISILFLFAFGSVNLWLIARLVHAKLEQDTNAFDQRPMPYAQIDEKAKAVKGADESAIRELVDAVSPLIVGDSFPALLSPYKERIVRAEINFRKGQIAGIPEANIVRVIDELAREFHAPEFAKTDEEEVRDIRLTISYMMPHFIVRQPQPAGEELSPDTIGSNMSPIEAVYVTRFLIMQKQFNESFLTTPRERNEIRARIKKLVEGGFQLTRRERGVVMTALIDQKLHPEKPQLTAEQLAAQAQQQTVERTHSKARATTYLSAFPASSRSNEMQGVFRRAYTMSIGDALTLTNTCFELLGIDGS